MAAGGSAAGSTHGGWEDAGAGGLRWKMSLTAGGGETGALGGRGIGGSAGSESGTVEVAAEGGGGPLGGSTAPCICPMAACQSA